MANEDLIMAQYKLYSEAKEKFIDRTFTTNKFYMVFVVVLMLLVFMSNGLAFGRLTAPALFSVIGIVCCSLWWLNMDSYNCLIKIKFAKVLEEIEKQLPVQPYTMEYKALKDYRTNKKGFVFSDIQKVFAVLSFLAFFIMLLIELIPNCTNCGI
ncbi:hypothetical protein IJ707_07285 [bacterium]|nr:hypothetical protein [bacterium]